MNKEDAIRVKFDGENFDEFVEMLEVFRNAGENIVMNFSGKDAYSADSRDQNFLDVLGKTEKEEKEFEEEMSKKIEAKEKARKEEVEKKLSIWKEKFQKYGIPEKMEEFQKVIEENAKLLYHGVEIEVALDIMEKIESGVPMEEIAEEFSKKEHSNVTMLARNIVLDFSEKGPDFYESTPPLNSNGEPIWEKEDIKKVEDQRREVREIRSVRHAKAKEEGIDMPYTELDAVEQLYDKDEIKDVDSLINFLKEKQERGIPSYAYWEGKKYYSFKEYQKEMENSEKSSQREELEDKVVSAKDEKANLQEEIEQTKVEIEYTRDVEKEVKEQQRAKDIQIKK